jgi:hypothetical protein
MSHNNAKANQMAQLMGLKKNNRSFMAIIHYFLALKSAYHIKPTEYIDMNLTKGQYHGQ